MIRLDKVALALVLILCGPMALAEETSAVCTNAPLISSKALERAACQIKESVIFGRYAGTELLSTYATDFDRRELVIVSGKNAKKVEALAGIKRVARGFFKQSRLLQPPVADQISKININERVIRHRKWVISTMQVEYGAQGDAKGYLVSCATAMRSFHGATTIVAECFSLEEAKRFNQILDAIN